MKSKEVFTQLLRDRGLKNTSHKIKLLEIIAGGKNVLAKSILQKQLKKLW